MTAEQHQVINAAIAWKETFGREGNQARWVELSQAIDNLISVQDGKVAEPEEKRKCGSCDVELSLYCSHCQQEVEQ